MRLPCPFLLNNLIFCIFLIYYIVTDRKLLFSVRKSKSEARPFYKIGRNNDQNTNILNDKNIVFPTPWAWLVLVILSFDIRICFGFYLNMTFRSDTNYDKLVKNITDG